VVYAVEFKRNGAQIGAGNPKRRNKGKRTAAEIYDYISGAKRNVKRWQKAAKTDNVPR